MQSWGELMIAWHIWKGQNISVAISLRDSALLCSQDNSKF